MGFGRKSNDSGGNKPSIKARAFLAAAKADPRNKGYNPDDYAKFDTDNKEEKTDE